MDWINGPKTQSLERFGNPEFTRPHDRGRVDFYCLGQTFNPPDKLKANKPKDCRRMQLPVKKVAQWRKMRD